MLQDARPARGGNWYALALHSHSRYSDGALSVAKLLDRARRAAIDGLAISDHNTLRQTLDPAYLAAAPKGPCRPKPARSPSPFDGEAIGSGKLSSGLARGAPILIPAEEWSSPDGRHAGLLGIEGTGPVDPALDAEQLFEAARARKAFVVINHPGDPHYGWPEDRWSGAQGIEVWNYAWGLASGLSLGSRQRSSPTQSKFYGLAYNLRSLYGAFFNKNPASLASWHRALVAGRQLTPIAASDFHAFPQRLHEPCTLVWAAEESLSAFMASLKAGRVALSRHPGGTLALIEGDADRDERYSAMAGDRLEAGCKLRLTVLRGAGATARVYGSDGLLLRARVTSDPFTANFSLGDNRFAWARIDRGLWPGLLGIAAPVYLQ